MKHYKDISTTLYIQDQEFPCTFSFDYEPACPDTLTDPGCDELVTITGVIIEPNPGFIVDIFTPEYRWLMVSDLHDALESDALYHLAEQAQEIEENKADYVYNRQMEAGHESHIL